MGWSGGETVSVSGGRDAPVAAVLAHIGERLCAARLARHESLSDAEAATRIRARYLSALEEGRPGAMPAEVYVKGFLRAYGEHLGLDGEALVAEYKAGTARVPLDAPPAPSPPRDRLARRRARTRRRSGFHSAARRGGPTPGALARTRAARSGPTGAFLTAVVVILAVALAGWGGFSLAGHWLSRRSPAGAATGTVGSVAGKPRSVVRTPSAQSGHAPTAQTAGASATVHVRRQAAVVVAARRSPLGWVSTYTVARGTGLQVRVTATGLLWTRRWIDGAATYQDIELQPGTSVVWVATRTMRVQLGNTHLVLSVNGIRLPALPPQGAHAEWLVFRRKQATGGRVGTS